MTPTLQTRKDGTGDCVRACIAGLLNLPVRAVPDFMGRADAHDDFMVEGETESGEKGLVSSGYPTWYMDLQEWLSGKGFFFLEVQLDRRTWMPLPFAAFAILIGERETEVEHPETKERVKAYCRHAIVGKCEGESFLPTFDPLGGNPLEAFADGKIQAVCFLVPTDPGLQVALGKAADATIRLARQLPWSEIRETILAANGQALGLPEVSIPSKPDPSAEVPRIITRDEPSSAGGIIIP